MQFNINKAIEILTNKLEGWLEIGIAMLPNMVVAVMVVMGFYFFSKLTRLAARRLLDKISDKNAINNLLVTLTHLFTIGIGLIMALNVLHLDQTVTSLLAGAGILGLAIGFAFQDISANFISGILIAFQKPIQVGDIIKTKDFIGVVERIDLRATVIHTFEGLHVIIPNKDVFQEPITNYTRTDERRIELEVGISYAEDLAFVKKVALQAAADVDGLIPTHEPALYYKQFADSSINFVLMLWVRYDNEKAYLQTKSDAIMSLKKAFDENGITIPFPIRTLDFGIKGGEKLSEMELKNLNK